jgi:hypothetical protein
VKLVEETGSIVREIRELEDQVKLIQKYNKIED